MQLWEEHAVHAGGWFQHKLPVLRPAQAWRQGLTGYPLVDAGMRQLWSTGWMHNRIRVVCASFLVKNLLLPWQARSLGHPLGLPSRSCSAAVAMAWETFSGRCVCSAGRKGVC